MQEWGLKSEIVGLVIPLKSGFSFGMVLCYDETVCCRNLSCFVLDRSIQSSISTTSFLRGLGASQDAVGVGGRRTARVIAPEGFSVTSPRGGAVR